MFEMKQRACREVKDHVFEWLKNVLENREVLLAISFCYGSSDPISCSDMAHKLIHSFFALSSQQAVSVRDKSARIIYIVPAIVTYAHIRLLH